MEKYLNYLTDDFILTNYFSQFIFLRKSHAALGVNETLFFGFTETMCFINQINLDNLIKIKEIICIF